MSTKNSALSQAVEAASSNVKTNSTKSPAYYNKERQSLERELAANENPVVRLAVLSNAHVSTGTLVTCLGLEEDPKCLRAILMHDNTPVKHLRAFASDERAEQFNDDQEVIDHLVDRIKNGRS